MAEVHLNLIGDIEKLPLSKELRVELTDCLLSISNLDLQHTHSISVKTPAKSTEVIILFNTFAQATVNALEACKWLPFPAGIICKAITTVIGLFFSQDVASVVIHRFTAILEAELKAKCRATCTKMAHCISYLQGLPTSDQLTQEQRNFHLQLVASDVPISIGLDEVLFLGEKIRDMVTTADLKETNKLFEHVQLYCCLATFRELFLLYRFSIQSAFSVESGSVRNVLDAQKANDKEVLQFLYKPTTKTVRLFRCCFLIEWPILRYFLRRRGLFPENVSELGGKFLKIRSVKKSGKILRPCEVPIFKEGLLLLKEDADDAATDLELRDGTDNVFTLWSHCYYPPRQVYCDKLLSMSISDGEPSPATSRWYLLKLQPELPGETTCYMIWLAEDYKKCVRAFWGENVDLSSSSKPEERYFWTLEIAEQPLNPLQLLMYMFQQKGLINLSIDENIDFESKDRKSDPP